MSDKKVEAIRREIGFGNYDIALAGLANMVTDVSDGNWLKRRAINEAIEEVKKLKSGEEKYTTDARERTAEISDYGD